MITTRKTVVQRLFDGVDAGIHTLPKELLELRAGLDYLAALPDPVLADEAELRQRLVEATMSASRRGEEPPAVAEVLEARRARELAELRRGVVTDAHSWFVGHGAEVWLPTPAEQDAAWRTVFGERLDRARDNRRQLDAYRQAFA